MVLPLLQTLDKVLQAVQAAQAAQSQAGQMVQQAAAAGGTVQESALISRCARARGRCLVLTAQQAVSRMGLQDSHVDIQLNLYDRLWCQLPQSVRQCRRQQLASHAVQAGAWFDAHPLPS